jgi:hypothetical protein
MEGAWKKIKSVNLFKFVSQRPDIFGISSEGSWIAGKIGYYFRFNSIQPF